MTRLVLPNRRARCTTTLRWNNTEYTVSISLFDDGAPAEVFITGASRDRREPCLALARERNNSPASIIRLLVEEMNREHARMLGSQHR
jgi:hypothetical protein